MSRTLILASEQPTIQKFHVIDADDTKRVYLRMDVGDNTPWWFEAGRNDLQKRVSQLEGVDLSSLDIPQELLSDLLVPCDGEECGELETLYQESQSPFAGLLSILREVVGEADLPAIRIFPNGRTCCPDHGEMLDRCRQIFNEHQGMGASEMLKEYNLKYGDMSEDEAVAIHMYIVCGTPTEPEDIDDAA